MNQFLFKKSDKSLWNIFHDERYNSVIFRTFNFRRVSWGEPVISIKNARQPISCDMDSQDRIHVAFTDKKGDIFYGCHNGTTIKPFRVLVSKNPSLYEKNISICCNSGGIFIFYTLRHNGRVILSMQEIDTDNEAARDPIAIDYIPDEENPYRVVENSNNIFIVYNKADYVSPGNPVLKTGVKVFSAKEKKFGGFAEISDNKKIDSFISGYIDGNNSLVICAIAKNKPIELCIEFIEKDSDLLTPELNLKNRIKITTPGDIPDTSDCFYGLAQIYNTKYYYCCDPGSLHLFKSIENAPYNPAEKFSLNPGRSAVPVYYRSNDNVETSFLKGNSLNGGVILPGTIPGAPKLFLFNPFAEQKTKTEELGTAFLETLKILKSEIAHLDESVAAQEKRIKTIENDLSNIEKELTKINIAVKDEKNTNLKKDPV